MNKTNRESLECCCCDAYHEAKTLFADKDGFFFCPNCECDIDLREEDLCES